MSGAEGPTILHTASEGITFARKLENDSAAFYESLAPKYGQAAESFLSFATENRKYVAQVERAYYGVITDAIEGCFAFNIDADDYALALAIQDGADIKDILKQAVEIEKQISAFYSQAAEQSKSLMADVPRAFMLIARKREGRLAQLDSLLKE
jgi:rubrerythrin